MDVILHAHVNVKKTHSAIQMHNIEVSRLGDTDQKLLLLVIATAFILKWISYLQSFLWLNLIKTLKVTHLPIG